MLAVDLSQTSPISLVPSTRPLAGSTICCTLRNSYTSLISDWLIEWHARKVSSLPFPTIGKILENFDNFEFVWFARLPGTQRRGSVFQRSRVSNCWQVIKYLYLIPPSAHTLHHTHAHTVLHGSAQICFSKRKQLSIFLYVDSSIQTKIKST